MSAMNNTGNASPKSGLYFTQQNIEVFKNNINKFDWADKSYRQIKKVCDRFIEHPDKQIYDCVIGMKGQVFAYGISGCPNCRKPFPMDPGEQKTVFSGIAELPEKRITCPGCGMTFPNEAYPDKGTGLEIGGKAYYLAGMWNFFHAGALLGGVRDHEGLATKLTYMYMLTGDQRYAHKALVILDAFSAIYPGTIGPRDFTPFGSELDLGRLHMLTSIVFRVKVCLAQDYDWLYNLKELDAPSAALGLLGKEGTMRQNIEGMLNEYLLTEPNGTNFNLEGGNLSHLQNHESDGVRAMLAVGLVLDNKDYCQWGVNAVEAYLYNTIGRDGMYYEGSFGYSLFTGTVFLDIALLASKASAIHGLKDTAPFDCDRFFRYLVENPMEMLCQGHIPSYGDWGGDCSEGTEPSTKMLLEVYRAALYFRRFTSDDTIRHESEKRMAEIYPLISGQLGTRGIDLFFGHLDGKNKDYFALPQGNTFMGQCGIVILRAENSDAVLMRIGQNNTHSHDDVLAYNYYSCGKEISADIGYGIYGTNAHYGWSSKSIAHNTVVVNTDETMEKGQLYKPFSGGEFSLIYESEYVNAFEGRAPQLYDIDNYQRMLGTVNIDENSSYVIDFFYVKGARTCDFAFHAFHGNSLLQLENAERTETGHWTLAGIDSEEQLYFDMPGKSFGERLATGETFSELLEDEQAQLWTPEKNNGYGYIYNVNEYKNTGTVFSAKWQSEQGCELVLRGIAEEGDRIFTALCPNLEGSIKYPILIHRSVMPEKQYAAVVQARRGGQGGTKILGMDRLQAAGNSVTAVHVYTSAGQNDFFVYSPMEQKIVVITPYGEWTVYGRCGWVRTDKKGHMLASGCINAAYMEYGGQRIEGRTENWRKVQEVDIENSTVFIDSPEPSHKSRYLLVRERGKGGSALYAVNAVEQHGYSVKVILKDSLILSKGIVKSGDRDKIATVYPLPLGINNLSPFKGKKIIGEGGGYAAVREIKTLKEIEIDLIYPFADGERFDIIGIEPGHEVLFL